MGEIADLFATLGLRVDEGGWAKGDARIRKLHTAVAGLGGLESRRAAEGLQGIAGAAESAGRRGSGAFSGFSSALSDTVQRAGVLGASLGGLAAFLGQRMVRSGVEFNATMEDSKNEVAGMLALVNKSHLSDELKSADMLVDHLRERAAKLPGTTQEYIRMLSMITQPIMDAKLGLGDLEDLTVQSVVAAKGLHVPWEVAARDIDQAIRGQFHSTDPFSSKVLGSIGFKGEEGRSRFNELSQEKRAAEFKRALMQPQFTELGEAAGRSFSGVLSTLEDAWEQFKGAIGKPLFDRLGEQITRLNAWLDANKTKISEVAEQIGGALVVAFDVVVKVIQFFVEHSDLAISILTAIGVVLAGLAIAWVAGFWPIFAVIAAVTALIYVLKKLIDYPGGIGKAFSDLFDAIKDGWDEVNEWLGDLPVIKQIMEAGAKIRDFFKKAFGGEDSAPKSDAERSDLHRNLVNSGAVPAAALPEGTAPISDVQRQLIESGGLPQAAGRFAPKFAPSIPASGSAGPVAMSISVGDIHVNAPNADPVAVGDQVRKVFHEELGNTIRKTKDAYG